VIESVWLFEALLIILLCVFSLLVENPTGSYSQFCKSDGRNFPSGVKCSMVQVLGLRLPIPNAGHVSSTAVSREFYAGK
jgi:hypothetical protein